MLPWRLYFRSSLRNFTTSVRVNNYNANNNYIVGRNYYFCALNYCGQRNNKVSTAAESVVFDSSSASTVRINEEIQKENKDIDEEKFDDNGEWFAKRYTDKSYHQMDGFDPAEWILLYRIPNEQQRDQLEYCLYTIAAMSLVGGCVIFAIACKHMAADPEQNPFLVAPGLWLVGVMAFSYATRLRRYGVIRLYARKSEQEQWERWRIAQLRLPPQMRAVTGPIRQYRLIWKDFFHRNRQFPFENRQISDPVHRKTWLSRSLNGSFLARGRPWALHPEWFDEPPDYIFVRRSH